MPASITEPFVPTKPDDPAEPPQGAPKTLHATGQVSNFPTGGATEDSHQLDKYPTATIPGSFGWLRDVENIDQFQKAVDDSYKGDPESESSIGHITIFGDAILDESNTFRDQNTPVTADAGLETRQGDELDCSLADDGHSDNSSAPGSKGFSPLFDTGAQVSTIPLETLERLKKGFTRFHHLLPEQRSQMALGDFRGQKYQPLGLVPLLWCLDAFPCVIFNTMFWVVDGPDIRNDLIIGKDVMRAAYIAIKEEKKFRSRGPQRIIKNAFHGSVGGIFRQKSKVSLHSTPRL